jgi:hypothetical protein
MSAYIDLHALLRIVVTCLLLGGGVSAAFATAVIGADRQATATSGTARVANLGLIVAGSAICLAAAGVGLWAMTQK